MKQGFVKVGRCNIEYIESDGISEPLIVFHGNSGEAALFRDLIKGRLGAARKIIAVSFPGHGASGPVRSCLSIVTIEALGRCAADIVKQLGYSRYWLLGQSVGGHALLEAAEEFPGAKGIILVSAPPFSEHGLERVFSGDPTGGLLAKSALNREEGNMLARAFLFKHDQDAVGRLTAAILKTEGVFREQLWASLSAKVKDEVSALARFRAPITAFVAHDDQFLNRAYYKELAPLIVATGGRLVEFSDCGHCINIDRPLEFERQVELCLATAPDAWRKDAQAFNDEALTPHPGFMA